MKITDADRTAARQERDQKPKMSAKAVSRLRALADERQRDEEANKKVLAHFERLGSDPWASRQVLERISRPLGEELMTPDEVDRYYDRRTLKLRRCLAMGWKPGFVHDVQSFGELTPAEDKMSDDEFYELMTNDWPAPRKVTKPILIEDPTHRLCANDRCTKGQNGARAFVTAGKYCSNACRSSMGRRLPPRNTRPRNSAAHIPLEGDQTAAKNLHLA